MHWIAALTLAVGFRQAMIGPMAVNIWYPSDGHAALVPAGLYSQTVVVNGPIRGRDLPLIVMSHGVSGSGFSDYNVALALANAGYVVAAVTHPGDNYQDQSAAGKRENLIDRPRHIHRLVDYMVAHWPVDAKRIGAFGFSLGGFTALVLAGGTPDLRQGRMEEMLVPETRVYRHNQHLGDVRQDFLQNPDGGRRVDDHSGGFIQCLDALHCAVQIRVPFPVNEERIRAGLDKLVQK